MSENKTPTPHKHADLIHKWADDTSLKFQYKSRDENWRDCVIRPDWSTDLKYRINPEVIRYRVALLRGVFKNDVYITSDEDREKYLQGSTNFIKWLTDWKEVEI